VVVAIPATNYVMAENRVRKLTQQVPATIIKCTNLQAAPRMVRSKLSSNLVQTMPDNNSDEISGKLK
jgi:hypothetical protein